MDLSNSSGRRATARVVLSMGRGRMAAFSANPTASQPSLEAVGEINLLTSDFSAEYAGVANVRVSTKRGGSGYNGSAFYNNKNSALAA